MTTEQVRDQIDEKIEPIEFLACRGELLEDEVEKIRAEAEAVAPRIGTTSEHWGSGGVDYPDRRGREVMGAGPRSSRKRANTTESQMPTESGLPDEANGGDTTPEPQPEPVDPATRAFLADHD